MKIISENQSHEQRILDVNNLCFRNIIRKLERNAARIVLNDRQQQCMPKKCFLCVFVNAIFTTYHYHRISCFDLNL